MALWAALCCTMMLVACGGGSGRQGTDVVVTGTGPSAQVIGGDTLAFTMTVVNQGPGDVGSMRLTNVAGNQLALVGIACAAAGGAVCPDTSSPTMTVDSFPAGGRLDFTVTMRAAASASGTLANTMTAQVEGDVNATNNQATAVATGYAPSSNLVVSGRGPAGTLTGGATAQFLMTVTNTGPDASSNVRIDSDLGNGLTLTTLTCTAAGGAVCPATSPSMFVPTLPAGGSFEFQVTATVGSSINGLVTSRMSVVADNDAIRGDSSFTATASVVTPRSGVFATGSGPATPVAGGQQAVFSMQVGNAGPDAAAGVTLVNQVGSNLSLASVSCQASGGAVCPASLGPVMSVSTLPAGGALDFTVTTVVAAGVNGTVVNTMTVAATNDSDRSDNSATAALTVTTPRARLNVSGRGPASTVSGGASAAFVMTVGNTGPDAAADVRIVNTVGSNLTFTRASCSASGGATCPATVGVVTEVPTLPVGGQLAITVEALVDAGANGAITNTVQATASNDASPGGSSAVAVGQAFTARSNLSVTGVGPSDVPAGTSASFQMTVTNAGPDPAAAVRLVNTVGGNLSLTAISCTAAGGATCPATGVTMDVADLPVGGTLVFNVAANVAAATQGAITNTLAASLTGGNRASVSGVAVGSAYANAVSVTGAAPAGPLVGGASGVFVMTVTNDGPGPARDLALSLQFGTGLTAGSAPIGCTATGSATCPASPAASMTIPTLPNDGALSFSFPAVVDAGANGTVSATFTATAAGDSRSSDNRVTASTTAASVDVGVSQTGASQVGAGGTAVFTAIVSNPGPAAATGLTLTHALSGDGAAGTTASISCSASGGALCPTTGPSMAVASLPAGRSLTFTISVPVPAGARGAIVSRFDVATPGDPSAANNSQSTTTTAVDARNGTYRVFAADGSAADLQLDFDASTYAMGGSATQAFVSGPAANEYLVTTATRFRVGTDLIVGSHDFGSGQVPYVAGRSFGTTTGEAQGQFNLASREVAPAGTALTRPGTVVMGNDGTFFVCQLSSFLPRPPSNCSGGLTSYTLTVDATGQYTATPVTGPSTAPFRFYVLRTGGSRLIVSAGDALDDLGSPIRRFRLGLPDVPAVAGGSLSGGSTAGEWVSVALTSVSYSATGTVVPGPVTAILAPISGSGSTSLLTGTRTDGARIYVGQAGPLAVVFGVATGTGNGLMQIVAP